MSGRIVFVVSFLALSIAYIVTTAKLYDSKDAILTQVAVLESQLSMSEMHISSLMNTLAHVVMELNQTITTTTTSGLTLNETLVQSGTFDWRLFRASAFTTISLDIRPSSAYNVYLISSADSLLQIQILELYPPSSAFVFPTIPSGQGYYFQLDNFAPSNPVQGNGVVSLNLANQGALSPACDPNNPNYMCSISTAFSGGILNAIEATSTGYYFYIVPGNNIAGSTFAMTGPWRFVFL